jgi:hypothetical protein
MGVNSVHSENPENPENYDSDKRKNNRTKSLRNRGNCKNIAG